MEPKIRLKGFCGEWEETTVGSVTSVNRGVRVTRKDLSKNGAYPVYQNTDYPMGYYAHFNVKANNPFVIVGGSAGLIGFSSQEFWAADDCAYFGDNSKIDKSYLYSLLLSKSREIKKNVRGSSVPRLDRQVIIDLNICLPSVDEQQALGTYFQHLDSLIQYTSKKLESLKQVKAASLQSMFPQEGETAPRVRFKGFEGEWENVELGECLTINNERNQNNDYDINDVLSVSDEAGVVNQIKLLGRSYAGKTVANYRILKTNQIVYTKSPLRSKPYGIVKVNKGPVGIVSVLYAVYDTKEGVDSDYIHYYFEPKHRINNYLLPLINKGAKNTMNISDEMALTGRIWIPSLEEQKKIADYFTNLDKQIALQSQRLEKLKQIKSACLDNMFV